MHKLLKKLEIFVDKILPYLIILLLFVIVIDLFYHDIAEIYRFYIGVIDLIIVIAFIIDLAFKYNRVRNISSFVRTYWLEILAIFPFYLMFRALEVTIGFLELSGFIKQGQNLLHTGIEVEKEIALISREAEEVERIGSRTRSIYRTVRTVSRAPRLFAAASFYEEPEILQKASTKVKKEIRYIENKAKKGLNKLKINKN